MTLQDGIAWSTVVTDDPAVVAVLSQQEVITLPVFATEGSDEHLRPGRGIFYS